jgi:uncharacterized membrane protein
MQKSTFEPNIAAALSYLITPFTGIAFFLIEKENKFVRFHAFQSILFGVAVFAASILANMLIAVVIGIFIAPLVSLVAFILWLMLMWKAYNNEEYELPILGKIAHDQINK